MRKQIASVVAGATFTAGLAVAAMTWPELDRSVGLPLLLACGAGLALSVAAYLWPSGREEAAAHLPSMPPLTAEETEIYQRTRLAQMRAEEHRALDSEEEARSRREFHRGLDAYTRLEPRAPPPLAVSGQAHMGTPGAAIFGIDEPQSFVAVDIRNFGRTPARDVTWKALTGWFPSQPSEPIAYSAQGRLGVTEPGHSQHIKLILDNPLTSRHIRRIVRGGEGFYVLVRIDYTTMDGTRKYRTIAYYLDPQGQQLPDRWMLSVCPAGNDEVSETGPAGGTDLSGGDGRSTAGTS